MPPRGPRVSYIGVRNLQKFDSVKIPLHCLWFDKERSRVCPLHDVGSALVRVLPDWRANLRTTARQSIQRESHQIGPDKDD